MNSLWHLIWIVAYPLFLLICGLFAIIMWGVFPRWVVVPGATLLVWGPASLFLYLTGLEDFLTKREDK